MENSGPYHNQIYKNDFKSLDFGISVFGENSTSPGLVWYENQKTSGLHIDCNDFGIYANIVGITQENVNDIYLNADATIDKTQGTLNKLAGNRFSFNPYDSAEGNFKINNNFYDLQAISYYYNQQQDETKPDLASSYRLELIQSGDIYTVNTTCPSNLGTPKVFDEGLVNSINEKNIERDLLIDSYKSILNGGIKPEIMAVLLDDFASTSEVHAKLAQGSPYLTDDVLIAAITREIPLNQWDLAQILMLNGRLSKEVLYVFHQTQPLTPFLANLVLSVDGSSMRYLLEMGIEAKNIEINNLEKEYVQNALFDESINVPYSKLAELYEQPESLEQLETTIYALIEQKNYSKAQEKLDDYLIENSTASVALMQMQIDLVQNNLNWFQLNELQLGTLEQIATDLSSKEYRQANALLDIINNNPLIDFEMPIDNGIEARKAQQLAYSVMPRDLMSISPNPSDGEVYIAYELPNEFSSAHLVLHNALGQQLDAWDVSSHPQFYKLNCEKHPSGIYSVSLLVDNKKIETQKLTLMTD